MRETKITSAAKMDWLGFGSLSVAIAAIQVFLDRGAQLDWFSSFEILIEATVCVSAFYIFLVHTFTATNSFVNPRLFLDRNFSVGMLFIFIVGITYLASLALLTPYLQTLMGYPVVTAGIVMGPRGSGDHGLHVPGRPPDRTNRYEAAADDRAVADRLGDVRHDRLESERLAVDDRGDRFHPGSGTGLPVRSARRPSPSPRLRPNSAPTAPASTISRATSAPASAYRSCPIC